MPTSPAHRVAKRAFSVALHHDTLKRAVVAALDDVPNLLQAAEALLGARRRRKSPPSPVADAIRQALDEYLAAAVEHNGGVPATAAALGVPRRTLNWRIAQAEARNACATVAP